MKWGGKRKGSGRKPVKNPSIETLRKRKYRAEMKADEITWGRK